MADSSEDLLAYLKLDPDHDEKIAALIPKETWYEQLIRYGLYIGAVFQMICILVSQGGMWLETVDESAFVQAVILLPEKDGGEDVDESMSDDDDRSRAGSPNHAASARHKHKRKQDKKKQKQL